MPSHIILVESQRDWLPEYPPVEVVTAHEYLTQPHYLKQKGVKVINLCRNYRYQSIGYYCSLLGEARRHKVIPSVRTLTDLSSKAIYGLDVDDLDDLVKRSLAKDSRREAGATFELDIFFGRSLFPKLQDLARQLFSLLRCPLLRVEFKFHGQWHIGTVKPIHLSSLQPHQRALFVESITGYLSKRWQMPRAKSIARYDLAMLYNPQEVLPPSCPQALRKFIQAGKRLGVNVELIEKKEYSRLAEYDALFIRETTRLDHHTYRFSKKAESEGMVVIDDPDSIVKCTNKVYLSELMRVNKIAIPETIILKKGSLEALQNRLAYPMVIKIPDGSFSRGVFKADNEQELVEIANKLFKESELILAQEFLYTEFDWRIGVLNRQPIYVCQYFMSKQHWQIVKHVSSGDIQHGDAKTWLVDEVSPELIKIAVEASSLIGDGLYGVDIKQTNKGYFVIEVNDNPSIDADVEDERIGVALYDTIMQEFVRRLELRKAR